MTKIAIVTGANKGIGYEIAKQIAETGVKTILACRTEALGKAAEATLRATGLDVEYRQLDVSDNSSIDAFAASFTSDYGALDILVNNAGIGAQAEHGTPAYGASAKPILATNYYGVLRLSDALLPLLRKAPFPRLVNVASGMGHKAHLATEADGEAFSTDSLTLPELDGFIEKFISDTEHNIPTIEESLMNAMGFPPMLAVYAYSKISLIAATRVVARDPANARVLINAGCPGFCATDMNNNMGPRPPAEGAKTLVLLALLPENSKVNGRFYENEGDSEW